MVESKWTKFKRFMRQAFCWHHDWYVWVNGKKKTCNKCDRTVDIK